MRQGAMSILRGSQAAKPVGLGSNVRRYRGMSELGQATFSTLIASFEFVRTGKLRALGVTTANRWETLPDVPAIGEVVPGYEASVWNGVAAPRGTPQDIIETLNREINACLADPQVKERLIGLGSVPMPMSPAEFKRLLIDDTEKWAKVIRAANIKPE